MIVTQQRKVPWWWAVLITLPAFSSTMVEQASGPALTYTMKKFVSDPAIITFLGSFNIAFGFMVAPFVAWKSDRIWTRFGRRKPFMVVGWIGLVFALIVTPLAPNIWVLALVIIFYQFCVDFAFSGLFEPLMYEVVPLKQRGRTAAIRTLMANSAILYFNFFLIGHFDEVHGFRKDFGLLGSFHFSVTGEQLIYWLCAALVIVMITHIAFNVKETHVPSPLIGERFSVRKYLQGIAGERQWLMIYLLVFSQVALNLGLAQLAPLLITEQFGYSKQIMGNMQGITILAKMILVIPLAGWISDKFDRLRLFQIGLVLSASQPILYWIFIKFIAVNQIPSQQAIVGFEMFSNFIDVAGNVALGPLLFDYIPRSRMGTIFSGMTLVRGLVKMITINGVGIWVSIWSKMTMPEGQYDYSSGLLYIFILGVAAIGVTMYFDRERKRGKIIQYGRIEFDETEAELATVERNTIQ